MYVNNFFKLPEHVKEEILGLQPNFGYGAFSEIIFYRTYSRTKDETTGEMETWNDVVIRVIEGCLSIRKDWYIKNHLFWDASFWSSYGRQMALSMFRMEWLPAGRGLWAMGSKFIYERGSMALNNCAFREISKDIGDDIHWIMDALMCGVGVGFAPLREAEIEIYNPTLTEVFVIGDTREAWCDSVKALIDSFLYPGKAAPEFDYSQIRGPGLPIRGFGGLSSGPEPLIKLHKQIIEFFKKYKLKAPGYDSVRLKTDLANAVGCCVVAGNVRRSAEIACGSIDDDVFLNLKNHKLYPDRAAISWMSNNSVYLESNDDYDKLQGIVERIVDNGEPGLINVKNFKYGRIGKFKDNVKKDRATGLNPCIKGSALVLTQNGLKRFDQIKIGERIWSKWGWTKVINFWSNGIKPIYKYTTTAGYFEGTEDHKIVSEGVKIKVGKTTSIDSLKGYRAHKFTINDLDPYDITDGLVHGDGTTDHGHILLVVGQEDQDYFDSEVSNLIGENYNKCGYYKIQTTHQYLKPTYEREVRNDFLTGNPIKVAGFLRGLYSANGSIVRTRVTLKAASFKTIEAVQIMLSSLGITSYWTTNKKHDVEFRNGTYECKESYDLNIQQRNDVLLFSKLIGFIQSDKTKRLQKIVTKATSKYANFSAKETYDIIKTEYLGEEEVFDITVDNLAHTFWCNGLDVSNCAEQPLENGELCNLAGTYPTVCDNVSVWLKACEYATVYASSCSLLPTHREDSNAVIMRNRRIGISIADFTGWCVNIGQNKVIANLRKGYETVRRTNKWVAEEAGVPESIRVTTVVPGGTTPKLAGVTSASGYPTFIHTLRRFRIAANSPMVPLLIEANIPHEKDYYSDNTLVFEFPILQGPAKPAAEASLWEQANNLVVLQREWSDNAVSNTLYFKPRWIKEKEYILDRLTNDQKKQINKIYNINIDTLVTYGQDYITPNYKCITDTIIGTFTIYRYNENHEEDVLLNVITSIAPHIKSASFLPHTYEGVYVQMPEEGISKEEFHRRIAEILPIDWTKLRNNVSTPELYCTSEKCEIVNK